ncbi:BDN_1c_G0045890.mRNA.1.CDS.1 [Saccharomyces cerevisiae]|nr:BDN_1c_G0045890.mRNA.1.CDS.1 [Saccharomyces cerevisiae]CAI7288288.1 BDN_1c_G0045890.mRNA.1.CDS.1 [Saccharomyces cerevisiae]
MSSRDASLTPLKAVVIGDPPLRQTPEPFDEQSAYNPQSPIAIDFGSSKLRAGFVNHATPTHIFPNALTKFRDRKLNKNFTFVGNDTLLDQAVRSQSRSPFDGPFVTNWNLTEEILDYTFHHLGVVPDNGIPNPILLTERLATVQSQRTNWYQILFETYNVPGVTFGIDSLFSFYNYNPSGNKTGLVISCGHEDTNVIPVVDGAGILTDAKRINWGGHQAVDYLNDLMALKYPYFPTKMSYLQYETMYKDYCYVSRNYDEDIEKILTLENLDTNDVVVEAPFTEVLQPQKTEEELRIQAEKRKETGKRLQEQARLKRMEKLVQKQEEFEYFSKVRDQLIDEPKKKVLSVLQNAGFDDERDFKKYLHSLEQSLKKAQMVEAEDDSHLDEMNEDKTAQKFDLLDIADEDLNEDQIKEKRKQRFLKASQDARQKAKEEKERVAKEEEEKKLKEQQWRETDLNGWIKDKRLKLNKLIKRRKEKLKLRDEMKDRKSQVSQNRMKNLASLAEDNVKQGAKRNRHQATIDNDPNDTFGANDEDWLIYTDITQNPEAFEEALEYEYKDIVELEGLLLEHDPNFTEEDTLEAQYDWRNSILHLFLRGPRPHDSENIHEQHQMHLNVERIRVPEVIFQPTMGGQDQAGICELSETILLKKFGSQPGKLSQTSIDMVNNVLITGGNAKVPGLKERIVKEFTGFLPTGTNITVNMSSDPSLDAWKGMAALARNEEQYRKTVISKKEYEEYGPEYIKEHKLGNTKYFED